MSNGLKGIYQNMHHVALKRLLLDTFETRIVLPVGIPIASHSTPGSFHKVSGTCTSAWAMANDVSP